MKRCNKCNTVKEDQEFHKNRSTKSGLDVYCKRCYKVWKIEHFVASKSRTEEAKRYRSSPHGRFLNAKCQAKVRKKEWTLSEIEYLDLVSDQCFYCNGPLPIGGGIDRLDNSKGYITGNVVPCCFRCNNLKGAELTWQETLIAVRAIQEYRRKTHEKSSIKYINASGIREEVKEDNSVGIR